MLLDGSQLDSPTSWPSNLALATRNGVVVNRRHGYGVLAREEGNEPSFVYPVGWNVVSQICWIKSLVFLDIKKILANLSPDGLQWWRRFIVFQIWRIGKFFTRGGWKRDKVVRFRGWRGKVARKWQVSSTIDYTPGTEASPPTLEARYSLDGS